MPRYISNYYLFYRGCHVVTGGVWLLCESKAPALSGRRFCIFICQRYYFFDDLAVVPFLAARRFWFQIVASNITGVPMKMEA